LSQISDLLAGLLTHSHCPSTLALFLLLAHPATGAHAARAHAHHKELRALRVHSRLPLLHCFGRSFLSPTLNLVHARHRALSPQLPHAKARPGKRKCRDSKDPPGGALSLPGRVPRYYGRGSG
jgi:hypothetical protein